MSASTVRATVVLSAEDTFRPAASPTGASDAAMVVADGFSIVSTDTAVMRRLAGALAEAADKADAARSQRVRP